MVLSPADVLLRRRSTIRYVVMPINSALKGATIDFVYPGGPSIGLQFHPHHSLFANSDSLEEGVRQFINNYTHYVYSLLDEYSCIVVRTATSAAIHTYFDFLDELISAHVIGRGKDTWTPSFSHLAAELTSVTSNMYYVPQGFPSHENENWAKQQTDFLSEQCSELENKRSRLLNNLGLQ